VVFGMPKEAIRLGAVNHIVPLNDVPRIIMSVRHVHG
jgi:chemotaxis response regulator CheB